MTARNAPPPQLSSSPLSSDSSSSSSTSSSPKSLRWPNLSEAENIELDTLGKKYLSDLTKDELAERNALLAHYERLSKAYDDFVDLPSWIVRIGVYNDETEMLLQQYNELDKEAGKDIRAWKEGMTPRQQILFECEPFDEHYEARQDMYEDMLYSMTGY